MVQDLKHSYKAAIGSVIALMCILAALCSAGSAQTTASLTQIFESPTTSSLPLGTQFFTLKPEAETTLPLVSMVADETSASVGPVTVRATNQPPPPSVTPLTGNATTSAPASGETSGSLLLTSAPSPSLPIKVDKSSTAAQALQLGRFERQNQIGEAYLLAAQLMRENPDEAFAYDAAIRTSLVLGLTSEVEKIYQQAIRRFPSQDKYYVQLAYFYQAMGKKEQLDSLIADVEKKKDGAPHGELLLARIRAIAGHIADSPANTTLPLPIIRQRAAALAEDGRTTEAIDLLTSASQLDLTRWEARTISLEQANLSAFPLKILVSNLAKSLANEENHSRAEMLVDSLLQQLSRDRKIDELLDLLTEKATSGNLSDPEAFVGARLTQMLSDIDGALYFVSPERSGSTPLVAFERARLFSQAGRTTESLAILENLLAEQPADVATRLLTAQQQAALGLSGAVLQGLAPLNLQDLDASQRRLFVSLTTSATVDQQNVDALITHWMKLGKQVPWSEIQLMGDIVVQGVASVDHRDALTSSALARVDAQRDAWPLYALLARLSGAQRDAQSELQYYEMLVAHDPENIALLRFVAELATQHSSMSLSFAEPSVASEITIQANDATGTSFAMQLYRRLIELQPGIAENYSALMRAYQMNGEVEAAKRVAVDLADRGSSTTQACLAAAGILEENGLTTDALGFYRAAVLAAPENFAAWMRYAGALRTTGKYREAEIIYRRILEGGYYGVPWNQPAIFANLLAIAHDTHRVDELVTYLRDLRAQDIPGKPEFYLSSAKLMMQVKHTTDAETLLREFPIAFPGSKLVPDALLLLGQLQYTSEDLEGARVTFLRVADEFSTSPAAVLALYNAGEVLRQTGKPAEAIELWSELARRFPEDDKALSALYEASLTAWSELRDPKLATDLMSRFVSSGSLDQSLLKRASASLTRMAAGEPPLVE